MWQLINELASLPGSVRFFRRIRIGICRGLVAGALLLLLTPLTFCFSLGLLVHLAFFLQKRIGVFSDDEFLQVAGCCRSVFFRVSQLATAGLSGLRRRR